MSCADALVFSSGIENEIDVNSLNLKMELGNGGFKHLTSNFDFDFISVWNWNVIGALRYLRGFCPIGATSQKHELGLMWPKLSAQVP